MNLKVKDIVYFVYHYQATLCTLKLALEMVVLL